MLQYCWQSSLVNEENFLETEQNKSLETIATPVIDAILRIFNDGRPLGSENLTQFDDTILTPLPPQVGSTPSFSLAHHHCNEFFVVDLTVAVNVGLPDHFIDLLVCELLAEVGHDVPQLGGRDEPVAVLVEDAERLPDLLLRVRVLHLARRSCVT